MTTSDWRKVLKQLESNPVKMKKYMKHNAKKERSCGKSIKRCRRCGSHRAHIDSYGLDLCRRCFRQIAVKIGFKKYN